MARRLPVVVGAVATVAPFAAAGPPSPRQPTESAVVRTGAAPCGLAARGGSLWVGIYGDGRLLRIDRHGRIAQQIRVGRSACRVAVGPSAVWVTRDQADEVVRLSPGSGRLKRVKVGAVPFDLLLANGFVWVTNWEDGTVMKIDPVRGVVRATVRVAARPTGLAACGGRIWVGHGRTATRITAIEPATLRVRQFAVGARPEWPHCIRGAVWVTTPDSVVRLNARTGRVLSRLRIGDTLADAAAAPDGLVWISNKERSLVHRVTRDGLTLVDSFSAGPGAFALARIGSSMWVTSFAGSDVRRFDP